MPRPSRVSRKPPPGKEVEKASKKVATTAGKKETKAVEKEIIEKPVAPPARATRSRGTVEVVIETSQPSQAAVASTRTSPDRFKPTTTRRRGQSQQPVTAITTFPAAPAAETSPPKRSTRSTVNYTATSTTITIEEVIRKTPSPKKPTRAAAKVPLHKQQKSNSGVLATPPMPEITPLSPEIQVPASSDVENHSPAGSAHFASSPPAILGTAPCDDDEAGPTTPTQARGGDGKRERIHLEFGEDEGYTPPRARPSSAERPRLRELGVESLEPLDRLPGDDVASSGWFAGDDEDRPASPTPKRANRWKLSQLAEEEEEEAEAGEEADLEDNDGIPASARSEQQRRKKRFGSPFQFQKGKKDALPPTAAVTAIEVEEMAFAIYSDPNTPSPTLPDNTNAHELDEIMRPPISSSPAQESPRHSRKRRSSSADVSSDDEEGDGVEEHHNQTRGGKRRKQTLTRSKPAAAPKPKVLQTEDLRGLLPKRKGRGKHAERDEFGLSPSSSEGDGEEDELSKPTKRKSKSAKKSKSKTKPKSSATTAAKVTKSAWSRPLVPTTTTATTTIRKKYARKSTGSEKENEAPRGNRNKNDDGVGEEDEAATTTSGTVVEVADGVLGKEGRKKLRDAAEKFRIVDSWEMDFEDVSGSTSI
ncbi:hypothetical protein HOY82DRAFT_575395 [Tuber indicum]|nr:hypothetical protein HOY82DRAFT_575395 [Tuber indicum]